MVLSTYLADIYAVQGSRRVNGEGECKNKLAPWEVAVAVRTTDRSISDSVYLPPVQQAMPVQPSCLRESSFVSFNGTLEF
jgi:hypothetical protein